MENKGENTQIPNKSLSVTDSNREPVNKVEERSKSFADKIVNKIPHIDSVKEIENVVTIISISTLVGTLVYQIRPPK
jgi:hypothetical protein